MRRSYLIHRFSKHPKHTVIRRAGGGFVKNPQEIRHAAISLLELANLIEQQDSPDQFDQDEYRRQEAGYLAHEIALEAHWIFGTGKQLLSDPLSTPYVYFATTPVYEDIIKIGASRDPVERMKQLSREHFHEAFDIIALAQTSQYEDLEAYLKYQFAPHKIFGEFFRADPIQWYLSYMQSIVKP